MQSLLIIGYVWPEPSATAAGSRMLQIIEQFQRLDYKITFVSPAQKPETAYNLEQLNIRSEFIELNNASFDTFVKKCSPTVVLFDRFLMEEQFGWRVAQQCPNAIRLLDSEDVHFLRKARQLAVKENRDLPSGLIHSDEAIREIASIYRCDATLTISEFEMDYLKKVYNIPEALLWYFPFLVTVDVAKKPSYKARQDFVFVGNFMHAPNWDAVLHLKKTLWPMIKNKLPKVNLYVYGAYPSEKVFQLHKKQDGFLIKGRADDVSEIMQMARVSLAPMRFGAGLKGKIIDAMQNKTPFVTSKIGAEGMFGSIDYKESIALSDIDFVEKSIALYKDKNLWKESAYKGTKVLSSRFCKKDYQTVFDTKLQNLTENLETYRGLNFIGTMLQHHSLKSTLYLSKWIEEKNKY